MESSSSSQPLPVHMGFAWQDTSLALRIGLSFAVVVVGYVFWFTFAHPLSNYPGPFLAKWSNLWRLYHVSRGSFHKVLQDLHRQYGPVVRIAPNVLDVESPAVIKTIYNTKSDWLKTEYYHASSAMVENQVVYNLFSQTDPKKHSAEKRPIAKYYSMNGVTPLEGHMDKVIVDLLRQLETRFINGINAGKTCNLGDWILFYTWDVVGAVTFSQPIGYLEKGRDFDGTLRTSEQALDYFSWVGCVPWIDSWLAKNPWITVTAGFENIATMSLQRLVGRLQKQDSDVHDDAQPDFLDKFIEAKDASPDTIDNGQIISWLMINLIAGADTTAISIRSAIFHCLKNPSTWARLRRDLSAAGLTAEKCPISYKESKSIPYLDAIVREALRILPGVSLPLERYVPEGGYRLPSGGFVPEGSIIGVNPYLVARNKEIYGADSEEFRPERWLRDVDGGETEEAFDDRLRKMNAADLSFGAGSRICIGKNLGLIQVYKVVATLAVLYDIELIDPKKDLKVINSWFPRQEGLEVRISKRA